MNGFTLLKDGYRRLLEQGKIDEVVAQKHIRIYEMLETCDKEDFCIMVDSAAFNDIISGYCRLAIEEGSTDLFGNYSAADALAQIK